MRGKTTVATGAIGEREVFSSVEELLAGAERREPFVPAETRSRAQFERVWIDGQPHVVKYLHPDHDFMMRAIEDPGDRTLRAFAAGLFDAAADVIDHAVVGAASGTGHDGNGCAFLMRDVSDDLVSTNDDVFPNHHAFIDHLARMCAATWDWSDDIGLAPYAARWTMTNVDLIASEVQGGDPERIVSIIVTGWEQFAERAPRDVLDGIDQLRRDVSPLATALSATPSCFLHGDWKASNLGTAADGRTVLIDWVYLGEGPACHELGWYLALNRQKLPVAKEQVMTDFRRALERLGVDTDRWWERQLALALLGTLVQFGWEKALGDDEELGWWCDRAREGLARL